MSWTQQDTTTHQDHVIAHVLGATVLGYFVFDESIYLLLDIGFFWQIYLDGEMGLLTTSLTIQELEAADAFKQQLISDSDLLLGPSLPAHQRLEQIMTPPGDCLIKEVNFFVDGENWRLLVLGEQVTLAIEASLSNRSLTLRKGSDF